MTAPKIISDLVDRFDRNRTEYRSTQYNETQVRREFVDPFFEALGWDVHNRQGWAELYKEVIHEDAIRIGGAHKAPDYAFRIGGVRKFFVETKKPATDLRKDTSPAYQLRRYAWSAKLPLSILTDFEEFAVYDTRLRPKPKDRASTGRRLYIAYTEYTDRWSEIAEVFSKTAILEGSFDRYVKSQSGRGSEPVDDAFLRAIEGWRTALARNIALRNKSLTERQLNFAVQQILDRIVFLRIAEDRNLENLGQLLALTNGRNTYARLRQIFDRANDRYDSGLFYFRPERNRSGVPDQLTPGLVVDDKTLQDVIRDLYYPQSPYEFSVIPADILGQVYERFLGKTIRLTDAHRAVVEDRPEVRKAGGVYYTPSHVVSFIVENTLSPLVQGKKPGPRGGVSRMRVVDPACGSGSFLLGAYQFLLDWHLEAYLQDGADRHSDRLYLAGATEWRLTTAERKRILLNNIYGVDIDAQAVEVTKLSLLLKVLEGENDETLTKQLALFHERALPDLTSNIRCGNSLVDSRYYDAKQLSLIDEEARLRVNAFDWEAEFPDIISTGGFDAVIGNPPYVLMQTLDQPEVFEYLAAHYRSAQYKIDTYQVFVEAGVGLLRQGGFLGFITPNTFLRNKHARQLREILLTQTEVQQLLVFDYPVFRGASVDTAVLIAKRTDSPSDRHAVQCDKSLAPNVRSDLGTVPQAQWQAHEAYQFGLPGVEGAEKLVKKLYSASDELGTWATAYFGIQTHSRRDFVADKPHGRSYKPVIDGHDIDRFYLGTGREYVDYRPEAIKSGGKADVYKQRRIAVRQIGKTPVGTIVPADLYTLNTIYNIYFTRPAPYSLEFVLGVLQSRTGQWYWEYRNFDQKRTFPKIKKRALLSFPVPKLSMERHDDKAKHDEIATVVAQLIAETKRNREASTPQIAIEAARFIKTLEARLDRAVQAAYGMDPEDAAIVRARSVAAV